jgi:hypothetical protein
MVEETAADRGDLRRGLFIVTVATIASSGLELASADRRTA